MAKSRPFTKAHGKYKVAWFRSKNNQAKDEVAQVIKRLNTAYKSLQDMQVKGRRTVKIDDVQWIIDQSHLISYYFDVTTRRYDVALDAQYKYLKHLVWPKKRKPKPPRLTSDIVLASRKLRKIAIDV